MEKKHDKRERHITRLRPHCSHIWEVSGPVHNCFLSISFHNVFLPTFCVSSSFCVCAVWDRDQLIQRCFWKQTSTTLTVFGIASSPWDAAKGEGGGLLPRHVHHSERPVRGGVPCLSNEHLNKRNHWLVVVYSHKQQGRFVSGPTIMSCQGGCGGS